MKRIMKMVLAKSRTRMMVSWALGRDWTHVYIVDDEDGVDQVEKKGSQ
jgi:hypothetical protein